MRSHETSRAKSPSGRGSVTEAHASASVLPKALGSLADGWNIIGSDIEKITKFIVVVVRFLVYQLEALLG